MLVTKKKLNRLVMTKLPAAYFCGVKIEELTSIYAVTTLKYKWITTNPFRSIYFAVLAMAAELSTGSLVLKRAYESDAKYSTLVVGMQAEFLKKAVGKIRFECSEGNQLIEIFENADAEPQSFDMLSTGYDESGAIVAKFTFNWSIKKKV